jgi:hypothetical protein
LRAGDAARTADAPKTGNSARSHGFTVRLLAKSWKVRGSVRAAVAKRGKRSAKTTIMRNDSAWNF